jgi:hypothetical protein
MTVLSVSTTLIDQIKASWEKDNNTQEIIQDIYIYKDPNSHPYYKWENGHLNRKM